MDTAKDICPSTIYGENVFNDSVMRERLPKDTYKKLRRTIEEGLPLDPTVAEVVANAMKDWAIEKGATHYTHWFQPLTGITAEKHDSFISPTGDGRAVMEFSGKELIKGEPDASSFPSGGLRATFEARGYTAWDCTSPAFYKDGTLYIPTAFCSYTGEALDLKTPLLRSAEALNKQTMRILRLFGNTSAKRVVANLGPEQEYFLVDREQYDKRLDLIICGRTLFGAKPPKGQELEDQYFGRLRLRIGQYMHDLDTELWRLGISAKTKHNEVAPAQHELAPIYDPSNIATDHNNLVMELMKTTAKKEGLAALLHEKPFEGVNGSGKHLNWSICTNDGENLLNPGTTPHENAQFLLVLSAVIKAVDEYGDLLRLSIASAGNDHRLGANEAPPAIVSMFLGDELTAVLEAIEEGKPYNGKERTFINVGVTSLPPLPKDTTDRNRTSPFAFTGNKFEFRMCGSAASISEPAFTLNTIVSEELAQYADRLEKASDFDTEVAAIIKETVKDHKRIIFNGNNYTDEWVDEAHRRGLPDIRSTVLSIPSLLEKKNVDVFEKHGVLTKVESESRYEIMFEKYIKVINIEALTMIDMAGKLLLPATLRYLSELASLVSSLKAVGVANKPVSASVEKLSGLAAAFSTELDALKSAVDIASAERDTISQAKAYNDIVIKAMNGLREVADTVEGIVPSDLWPIPTYSDLLFKV
ncbi:MAG: glutamine synthetase III [Clostridia bacterium]|nr:glutamine synthetase III [Clostridia bacterium]